MIVNDIKKIHNLVIKIKILLFFVLALAVDLVTPKVKTPHESGIMQQTIFYSPVHNLDIIQLASDTEI